MDEIVKYAIANGPWAVICLGLALSLRYMAQKNDKLQEQLVLLIREGNTAELASARAMDSLGVKVDGLGTIVNRIGVK